MLDFGAKRNQPTVLLIDDDMVSREVLATVLTLGGYTVHTAEDGAAALSLLAAGGCVPAVILMDAHMPGVSGPELIAALRKLSPALLVAMSGSNAPQELTATADGFLLKPFGAEALDAALEELKQKTAQDAAQAEPGNATKKKKAQSADPMGGEPVVKPEVLAQFRQMMPEAAVREIYEAVVADLRRRLPALDAAIAAGSAEAVRSLGHAIKGGCGMAGAMQASRLGALLEAQETQGNQLDNSARLVSELRNALANLESMLSSEF